MDRDRLKDRLIEHEGLRLKPYPDEFGLITIGIGRCLDKKGITKEEAFYLFENDIDDCLRDVTKNIKFFSSLDDIRQEVIVEMCFQLGIGGLLGFEKFLYQLERKNYSDAAREMLNSMWAKQTPGRAKELSQIIEGVIKVT
jgi:lysozyme